MAYERYKANVQAFCDELDVRNPIQEDVLAIQAAVFFGIPGYPRGFTVEATDMNRAGRLYLEQQLLDEGQRLPVTSLTEKGRYAEFFTSELWDACNAERSTLVFGMKHCTYVVPQYKEKSR